MMPIVLPPNGHRMAEVIFEGTQEVSIQAKWKLDSRPPVVEVVIHQSSSENSPPPAGFIDGAGFDDEI